MIRGERAALRPATPADLDLLAEWFTDPELYRWWGGRPLSREEVEERYVGRRSPQVESFVVEAEGEPVGYIQYWLGEEPRTGGLDMLLVPEARGRGLGSDAARALVRHLIEERGWRRITVDPAADNGQAIQAWKNAGFSFEREIVGEEGKPALLMVREA